MRAAEEKYGDDLIILFVDERESVEEVFAFASRHGLFSEFLLDMSGEVGIAYRIFSTPTTFFLDRNGVIQGIQPGLISLDWIDQFMKEA